MVFLKEIPLYSPFKVGQSIIIKISECIFEIFKEEVGFQIIRTSNSEGRLVLQFKNVEAFQYLLESRDLSDYGNRLVTIAIQGKIIMDPGPYKDPMKSGFHRFIGYIKKKKGLQTYICTVPVF